MILCGGDSLFLWFLFRLLQFLASLCNPSISSKCSTRKKCGSCWLVFFWLLCEAQGRERKWIWEVLEAMLPYRSLGLSPTNWNFIYCLYVPMLEWVSQIYEFWEEVSVLKHIQDFCMSCRESSFCPAFQRFRAYKMATKIVITISACCIDVLNFELVKMLFLL